MDDLERAEFERKLERVRTHLRERGYRAALIGRQDDFAWITTGGDNRVLRTVENGVGILAITPDRVWLVAYTMDAARVHDDELAGSPVEVVPVKWHEGSPEARAVALCGSGRVLSDVSVPGAEVDPSAFARLQHPLSDLEVSRCRELGARSDAILRRVADGLRPDRTEADVAAELVAAYEREGMTVEVCLVGGTQRIPRYRHPLPSATPIGEVVLLHPAVRWRGLHANVTRMVCLGGSIPPDLERRYEAVCRLQALTLAMCLPGTPFRAIFEARRRLYAQLGFPDDWELHFPGGPTGYKLVEPAAGADPDRTVSDGQVFDWFVTVTGAKVEELSLTRGGKRELLSAAGAWPTRPFTSGDLTVETPWLLVR
jgi:Xaa-Pro aminopeptidase